MDQEIIEQFLLWLKEQREVPHLQKGGDVNTAWYKRGYKDATDKVTEMYQIAFQDRLE